MPEEQWTEVCDIVQEIGSKTILKKKKCERAKWLSEEALQIAEKRREKKGKGEKGRYINAEFQRTARRNKAFLSDQCKETEENDRTGKTRDLFKKIRDIKGTFHAKMGLMKDRNGMYLREFSSVQFISVTQSCLTLCDPTNCSTPGLPVHHQLPEFTQTQRPSSQ